jgi:hypothetical protein
MSPSTTSGHASRIVSWLVAAAVVAPALALSATTQAAAATPATPATPATLATSAAASYDSTVLADSPRYYFPLNETTGAVRDLTGTVAPSTITGAQLGVPGVQSTAASFDGGTQRVQVPYSPAMQLTGSFSVELWAKLPAAPQTSGWPSLFSRGSGAPGKFGAAMWVGSDAAHQVRFKRNGTDVSSARGLTSTAYRHLVFTWDAAAKRYTWYVDGTQDVSGLLPALSGVDTETAPLTLGAFQDAATSGAYSFGKVLIDGLAVYTSVLPATRVAAHYTAGATTTAPATVRRVGGVAVGGLQPWNTRRAADFAAMAAANVTYLRTDMGWKWVQPTATTWDWNVFGGVLADMQANGLKYLAVLHTTPGWANGNAGDGASPTNLALLNEYCYRTVQHYLPQGVVDYEIGNEVNYPQSGWVPNGTNYAQKFLIPCATGARRAATELGLPVNIMFGSMGPGTSGGGQEPLAFLTDAYAAGARGLTNSLAFHPYGGTNPAAEGNMITLPDRVYAIMQANGEGSHKIWATEYGIPTGGDNSWSEQVQAEWIPQAFDTWAAHPYAGPLFWYAHRDLGTSATDREQHFGVLRVDGSAKPGYAALKAKLVR